MLGAKTGIGKTALATITALHNCQQGKRVHYFALEAEEREIERRMKFQIIADLYDQDGKFYRSAVVADVGSAGLGAAQRYCNERNKTDKTEDNHES